MLTTQEINELKKAVPDVKISFAYHIQQKIFEKAYTKYGFIQSEKYQDINGIKIPYDDFEEVQKAIKEIYAEANINVGGRIC